MSKQLLEALAVTAELMGNDMSPAAAKVMYSDLSFYPANLVIDALVRVRREVKGRLSISDIISRIDDGRPGVEEAWAMMPLDEGSTVVWTNEMRKAFFIALPIIQQGDMIAARMAFKESYKNLISIAKSKQEPVQWAASLGHDPSKRETVLVEAVCAGRLTNDQAIGLCHEIKKTLQPLKYDNEGVKRIEGMIGKISHTIERKP